MEPTANDVLSGRGVSFNRHPGNEQFRLLIDKQTDAYGSGTKKQKMAISRSIAEAIYALEPPGRFLKKDPDTGEWIELSLKEAATRTSQAMAYAVRERSKQQQQQKKTGLNHRNFFPSHVNVHHDGSKVSMSSDETANRAESETSSLDIGGQDLGLLQQLIQLQQSSGITHLPTSTGALNGNGLAALLQAQSQQQQQQSQLQELLLLQQLTGQNPLVLQSLLPSQSLPSQGGLMMQNDILSRSLLQGNLRGSSLMGSLQPASLLQNQVQLQSSPTSNSAQGLLNPLAAPAPQQPLWSEQNQLLASLLSQNNQLAMLQQQSQPLNLLQQQALLLQQQQNSQNLLSSSSQTPLAGALAAFAQRQEANEGEQTDAKES